MLRAQESMAGIHELHLAVEMANRRTSCNRYDWRFVLFRVR
jgi:hypothetical protein